MPVDSGRSALPTPGWRRALTSVFIVFSVTAVLFSTSKPYPERSPVERLFFPYLNWTRTLQQWRLFVPNPRMFARKYHVEIRFRDNTTVRWHRPYPPNWDFFSRHMSYNFQKWDLSNSYLEDYSWLREDLIAFLERLYWNDSNPPTHFKLIVSNAAVPPPNETGYVQHDESEFKWEERVLYERKAATSTPTRTKK